MELNRLAIQGFEGTDILQHPPSPVPEGLPQFRPRR
jgi:hypothetical protein